MKSIVEALLLRTILRIECNDKPLGILSDGELRNLLGPNGESWERDREFLDRLALPEMRGGVNPGDQRAIYELVLGLRPKSILEVGTHIGCSTTSIALAMRRMKSIGFSSRLWTIDLYDVNDSFRKPWLKHGSSHSPREIIASLSEIADAVSFLTMNSIEFFGKTDLKFDLIFLDGSHKASQVYREIPIALSHLNEGGFILLHDYFPNLVPLWSDGKVISGPWLALERLKREGLRARPLPLGALPWPTKLNSNSSSLCLLTREALS
jgi:predicted O-methyltransferase YrrM